MMSVLALPSYYEEEIPALLQEMRWVADYSIEPNPCPVEEVKYRGLREMFKFEYLKFRDRLEKMEVEWLGFKKAKLEASRPSVRSEWNGKGKCPVCKREAAVELTEDECIGKVEGWIGKQPGG